MNGYQGKFLRVNLSERKTSEEPIDEAFAMKYIGGVGFGIRWLYDSLQKEDDPLSPKSPLIFASGPLASINF